MSPNVTFCKKFQPLLAVFVRSRQIESFNFGFVSGTGKQKFYDLFASFPTFYGKFFRA